MAASGTARRRLGQGGHAGQFGVGSGAQPLLDEQAEHHGDRRGQQGVLGEDVRRRPQGDRPAEPGLDDDDLEGARDRGQHADQRHAPGDGPAVDRLDAPEPGRQDHDLQPAQPADDAEVGNPPAEIHVLVSAERPGDAQDDREPDDRRQLEW